MEVVRWQTPAALHWLATATLVAGGDGDFDAPPVDVDVERFRNHGVRSELLGSLPEESRVLGQTTCDQSDQKR